MMKAIFLVAISLSYLLGINAQCLKNDDDGTQGRTYENAPTGTVVTTFSFSGIPEYTFEGGGDLAKYFDIDGDKLKVKDSALLDRIELKGPFDKSITIEGSIRCTDTNSSATYPYQTFVEVFYQNKEDPIVTSSVAMSQTEYVATGTIITTVTANDGENTNYPTTFNLKEQVPPEEYFELNAINGRLTLLKDLDFSQHTKHILTIEVTDDGFDMDGTKLTKTTEATLTINIDDYDNLPPAFQFCGSTSTFYTAAINTNQDYTTDIRTEPCKIEALDGDTTLNESVVYSFDGETKNYEDFFAINGDTGAVTTKQPVTNTTTFAIAIKAAQKNRPDDRFTTTYLQITATAQDENKPVFSETSYSGELLDDGSETIFVKDADTGSLLRLVATDDVDLTAPLIIYTIEPTSSPYQISSEGYIFVRSADLSTTRAVTSEFTVTAINANADQTSPNRKSDPVTVSVDVIEVTTQATTEATTEPATTEATTFPETTMEPTTEPTTVIETTTFPETTAEPTTEPTTVIDTTTLPETTTDPTTEPTTVIDTTTYLDTTIEATTEQEITTTPDPTTIATTEQTTQPDTTIAEESTTPATTESTPATEISTSFTTAQTTSESTTPEVTTHAPTSTAIATTLVTTAPVTSADSSTAASTTDSVSSSFSTEPTTQSFTDSTPQSDTSTSSVESTAGVTTGAETATNAVTESTIAPTTSVSTASTDSTTSTTAVQSTTPATTSADSTMSTGPIVIPADSIPASTFIAVTVTLSVLLFLAILAIIYLIWRMMKMKKDKDEKLLVDDEDESQATSSIHQNGAYVEENETYTKAAFAAETGYMTTRTDELVTDLDADLDPVDVPSENELDAGSIHSSPPDPNELDLDPQDEGLSPDDGYEDIPDINENNYEDADMDVEDDEQPVSPFQDELRRRADEIALAAAATAIAAKSLQSQPDSAPRQADAGPRSLTIPPEIVEEEKVLSGDAITSEKIVTLRGHGEEGEDLKALMKSIDMEMAPSHEVEKVRRKIALMEQLSEMDHPNIVTYYGSYEKDGCLHYACKHAENGSLQDKLRNGEMNNANVMMHMMAEIGKGLQYLHAKNITHGKLWSKSIVLDADNNPMLTDIEGDNAAISEYSDVMRWQALEVNDQTSPCTPASDVWSYGTLMWEMVSQGAIPYDGVPLIELPNKMREQQLPMPKACSESLFSIMTTCWNHDPKRRPDMYVINSNLSEKLLEDSNEHISLELANHVSSPSYDKEDNFDDFPPPPTQDSDSEIADYTAF